MGKLADDDLVDRILKTSGCFDAHYKVQECISEHKDWRRCKDTVEAFKKCMKNYTDLQNRNRETKQNEK